MQKRDDQYWERKMQVFLHDPMDKALRIQGHEERAGRIADAFGIGTASKSDVRLFDIIAAGLDRANLPGYSSNDAQNGAVDFSAQPQITHPITPGRLTFSEKFSTADQTNRQIVDIVHQDTASTEIRWDKQTYFSYLFFVLRKRLIAENAGNLGFLWDRIPADSRIPDHSIWNHAAMVSAIHTCVKESDLHRASMMVFSLTPVQPFITKTRKLRDHWVASVMLSWLSFEGIRLVMNRLGPDHILYPSLQDQPLVEAGLAEDFSRLLQDCQEKTGLIKDKTIASFPNKFVFLAPAGREQAIAREIQERIESRWQTLARTVLQWLDKDNPDLEEVFQRQTTDFWQFNWAGAHLVDLKGRDMVDTLFDRQKFNDIFETIQAFSRTCSDAGYAYPVTHSLVQSVMAASKNVPFTNRSPEPGIKCPVCGEFEILHGMSLKTDDPGEYKKGADRFWNHIAGRSGGALIKEGEALCSICAIKRLGPLALATHDKAHILNDIFKDESFPSTTEMATFEYRESLRQEGKLPPCRQNGQLDPVEKDLIDGWHEAGQDTGRSETDLYYAILMMDGDKMGDLVNGTTIAAKWKDVLHPELVERYTQNRLTTYRQLWMDEGYLDKQRILSPALHTTLSESLGAFSLYVVPRIIRQCRGRLIYAGGDDVAAVLPLSRALEAADQIRQVYRMPFITLDETSGIHALGKETSGQNPIFTMPGKGKGISISGAVLVCHHKQPLRGALEEAHLLLDQAAKEKQGRNAVAIRLKKRSGQSRDFAAKWDAENIFCKGSKPRKSVVSSFMGVQEAYAREELSGTLIYRLPELEVMVRSVLDNTDQSLGTEKIDQILRIFAREILHSGSLGNCYPGKENDVRRKEIAAGIAADLAGITIQWEKGSNRAPGRWRYNAEAPVIARYLSRGGATA
jgi:CRISPR-associated protein Cmr2